ncbi:MAG: FtsQ-type POTRA domain-containing protein [Proteobacteria bacterium]|nr:FtsQ-type POTRA domain-containing protein [Pseudomonadota bacterium]
MAADLWLQMPAWQYLKDKMILNTINIQGTQRLSAQEIMDITGIAPQMDIMSIDLSVVKNRLEENPWVENAEIRRIIPDILTITIQEAIPSALWINNKDAFLVSRQGRVLDKVNNLKEYKNYLMLFGNNAPSEHIKIYDTLYRSAFFSDILSISRVGNRRWDVYLRKRVVIKLPEKAGVEVVAAVDELLRKNAETSKELQMLDMRLFPEKIFVKYAKAAD